MLTTWKIVRRAAIVALLIPALAHVADLPPHAIAVDRYGTWTCERGYLLTNHRCVAESELPQRSRIDVVKRSHHRKPVEAPAVDFCARIQTLLEGDRAYVEGAVANGAPFPVYNVRVCIKGECDYATPSTLQPGSQATFRVPAKLERYVSGPDYRITWEVRVGRSTRDGR